MNRHKAAQPLVFIKADTDLPIPRKKLSDIGRAIYSGEKIPPENSIHVIFCSDSHIKKLNAHFRGKPRPTDVLSFNYDEEDFLGEIYISLRRAQVQARQYGVSYNEEIMRLFVHGMIHLQGYDHEKPADRKRMEAVERKYFEI